ncbi:MAG TPA: AAA family ATPase [Chloroflexota bacterium]|nr:AAA family ATPase [Chloroflexota bacterium]
MPSRPILVCIAGGSASGKSTISRTLVERLGGRSCAVVNVDDYFRDWSVDEELRTANRPEAVLWPSLLADLDRLLGGEEVELPALGTRSAARGARPWRLKAADLIVVEGLMALWHDELRARADLAIYVDAPDDERLLRRISRDIVERGATVETAVAWYRHDVRPHFGRFTEPTKWRADLIVPNAGTTGPSEASLAALTAAVRALIEGR